jgi:hypothetical protein
MDRKRIRLQITTEQKVNSSSVSRLPYAPDQFSQLGCNLTRCSRCRMVTKGTLDGL